MDPRFLMIIDAQINTLKTLVLDCEQISRSVQGLQFIYRLLGAFTIWQTSHSILLSSFISTWLYTAVKRLHFKCNEYK